MKKILNVQLIRQKKNQTTCGVVSLEMVLAYHGLKKSTENLIDYFDSPRQKIMYGGGMDHPEIAIAAERLGFEAQEYTDLTFKNLVDFIDKDSPIILRYRPFLAPRARHFCVLTGYDTNDKKLFINDPNYMLDKKYWLYDKFKKWWNINGKDKTTNYGVRIRNI